MNYETILAEKVERVGVITLNRPPLNAVSKRMMAELLDALEQFEQDDEVRAVMLKSAGPDFSYGADGGDITKNLNGQAEEITESFSVLGNRLVERIDCYPKPTLVAAGGRCIGGSTAVFNAFDIRIVGENFRMHDGDIYYGTVGSWGMSSLRLSWGLPARWWRMSWWRKWAWPLQRRCPGPLPSL